MNIIDTKSAIKSHPKQQMNFRVEENLKNKFTQVTHQLGTNPTQVLIKLMTMFVNEYLESDHVDSKEQTISIYRSIILEQEVKNLNKQLNFIQKELNKSKKKSNKV